MAACAPVEIPAVVSNEPIMVEGTTSGNVDGLTPLPDLNDAELITESGIDGWHSEIFDFSQIEAPVTSTDDPMPVTDSGLSIDGYFGDGIPGEIEEEAGANEEDAQILATWLRARKDARNFVDLSEVAGKDDAARRIREFLTDPELFSSKFFRR